MDCKIYVLKDPITRKVRYVGKTVNTLSSRRSSHVAKAVATKDDTKDKKTLWIKRLLLKGYFPIIKEVDTVPSNEASQIEFDWILYFTYEGCKLLNKHGLSKRSRNRKALEAVEILVREEKAQKALEKEYAKIISQENV